MTVNKRVNVCRPRKIGIVRAYDIARVRFNPAINFVDVSNIVEAARIEISRIDITGLLWKFHYFIFFCSDLQRSLRKELHRNSLSQKSLFTTWCSDLFWRYSPFCNWVIENLLRFLHLVRSIDQNYTRWNCPRFTVPDKAECTNMNKKRYDILTLTWKVLSVEEGGVSGEWWICRVIIGVEDGLLEDGALVSLASLSHTEPGDQISLFLLPILDETSLGFVLRFNGTSSSETKRSIHTHSFQTFVCFSFFSNEQFLSEP